MKYGSPQAAARLLCAITALAFTTAMTSHGQLFAPGPAATGLAGGGPAFVYGPEASFLNPANLTLGRRRDVQISTGRASLAAGGNLLQFRFYNELFTNGNTISDEQAHDAIDRWFGGVYGSRSAGVGAEAVPVVVVHPIEKGAISFAMRMRTYSSLEMNGGWLELLLAGGDEPREIPLSGSFGALSTTEFSVGLGILLDDGRLAVGAASKLVFGNDYLDARLESTATVSDNQIAHRFQYSVRSAGNLSRNFVDNIDLFSSDVLGNSRFAPGLLSMAGVGAGLDFGATYLVTPQVRFSVSVTDLGFIGWSSAALSITPLQDEFLFEGLVLDIDRVRNEFGGDVAEYFTSTIDSLATTAYDDVSRDYGPFQSALPTTAHVGAQWTPIGPRLKVAGGTSFPIVTTPIRLASFPDAHAGVEYSAGGSVRVPLRAGVRLGGASALTLAFGVGLHTAHFDVEIGMAASPRTDFLGAGARYMAGVSAVTIRL